MRISKDGRVSVTKSDLRVGNFVYSDYADSVLFSDISRTFQARFSKRTLIGQMLSDAIRGKMTNFLHNYAGFLYYLLGTVPDQAFIEEAFSAARGCLGRHPELYGQREVSDGEDAAIIEAERELSELEERVRSLPDDAGE